MSGERRYPSIMRAQTLYVAAISILPSASLGLVALPHPHHGRATTRTAWPCRHHSNAKQGLNLAAGGGPPVEAAATAATGGGVAGGTSSPLSRAREVLVEPAFRNMHLPLMATAGALLGPNLDNYHSAFGVLTYTNPTQLSVAGHLLVTTDWW